MRPRSALASGNVYRRVNRIVGAFEVQSKISMWSTVDEGCAVICSRRSRVRSEGASPPSTESKWGLIWLLIKRCLPRNASGKGSFSESNHTIC